MAMVFALLIVAFVFLALVHLKPDRWVYFVLLVISLIYIILFTLQWIARADFIFFIPYIIRKALTPVPETYSGISFLVMMWVAVARLWFGKTNQG
ncbi:MAG: hypothetical protein M1347_07540 [Chloroflexi bacterium]|nr:hypothetical protein [Chloroflexota bacterium]